MSPSAKTPSKGPLRWEAIVPATLLFALVSVYLHFFFDGHLRRLLEMGATKAHGAEVNIGDLKLSLLGASLKLRNMEVTDPQQPSRNLFEIERVDFELVSDALLRAKVVVERADVLGIKVHSPRRRPGRVLPPSQKPALTDEARALALGELERTYSETVLEDLGEILGGVKPEDQLKGLKAELSSTAALREAEASFKKRQAHWSEAIEQLPSAEDVKSFEARFEALQKDGFKNVSQVQASLQELEKLYQEVGAQVQAIEETSAGATKDLNWARQQLHRAQQLASGDVQNLLKRLNIPSLDSDSLTQALFAGLVLAKITPLFRYVDQVQERLPAKRSQEQTLTPRERRKGRNVQFPITKGYPLFWLKSSQITSKSAPGSDLGDFEGSLRNVTDNPQFVGQPAILEVRGDVPAHGLRGLFLNVTVDHTGEIPTQSFEARVDAYPAGEHSLSPSGKVQLGFSEARGQAALKGQFQAGAFQVELTHNFLEPRFVVQAESSALQGILERATSGISRLDLLARMELGGESGLRIRMRSNLGEELEKAAKNEIATQVHNARAQAEKYVRDAFQEQRQGLDQLLASFEAKVSTSLKSTEQALKAGQARIVKTKEEALKAPAKETQDKLKEEGKKLLKGLGF